MGPPLGTMVAVAVAVAMVVVAAEGVAVTATGVAVEAEEVDTEVSGTADADTDTDAAETAAVEAAVTAIAGDSLVESRGFFSLRLPRLAFPISSSAPACGH